MELDLFVSRIAKVHWLYAEPRRVKVVVTGLKPAPKCQCMKTRTLEINRTRISIHKSGPVERYIKKQLAVKVHERIHTGEKSKQPESHFKRRLIGEEASKVPLLRLIRVAPVVEK